MVKNSIILFTKMISYNYYNDIHSEMIIPVLYYSLYLMKFNIFILFH